MTPAEELAERCSNGEPMMMDVRKLIQVLQEMDHQQRMTDDEGGRENAWFYWMGDVEEALGVPMGSLETTGLDEEAHYWTHCTIADHSCGDRWLG